MEYLNSLYQYFVNNCCCRQLYMKINENEYNLDRLLKYTQHQVGRQRNIITRIAIELEKTQNEVLCLIGNSEDDVEIKKSKLKLKNLINLLHNYSCNNLFIDEQYTSLEIPCESETKSASPNKLLNTHVIMIGQKKS